MTVQHDDPRSTGATSGRIAVTSEEVAEAFKRNLVRAEGIARDAEERRNRLKGALRGPAKREPI